MSESIWPGTARAAVALTFDVDAESSVLFDAPDARHRLSIMSHQAYGARVGVPRFLKILRRHDVRATFFVPGFTAERHPNAVRAIVNYGHEIGHHGYLHESVTELDDHEEEDVLRRGLEILERLTGRRPAGWRGPMWEVKHTTPALLASYEFAYDSSLMDDDVPYLLRVAPDDDAPTLVEIPVHWGTDDGEQYAWLPGIWEGEGIASAGREGRGARGVPETRRSITRRIQTVRIRIKHERHPLLAAHPSRRDAVASLLRMRVFPPHPEEPREARRREG